ncbi:MAG TPA: dipeptidase [Polyangiales bacterium]|nr:dipeptidase [Polyangiales bacterium]
MSSHRFITISLLCLSIGCAKQDTTPPKQASVPSPAPAPSPSLHEQLLTLDTHLDTPANFAAADWDIMQRHEYAQDLSQVDYPRMVSGGLDGGFWAIYTQQGPRTPEGNQHARSAALQTALHIREMVASHRDQFELALRADDAAAIVSRGKRVVFMSIENSYPLGRDLSLMRDFYAFGVRMIGPVHFSNNDLADSSTDPKGKEWNGLSPLGKEFVAEANRLGMVLDASHASDDVFDQFIALSKTPIMLSHSGCKAVFDHPRNIDDERMKRLAAAGGVIQINSLSDYLIPSPPNPERKAAFQKLYERIGRLGALSAAQRATFVRDRLALERQFPAPRATFEDFMRHMVHALQVVGPDHVGIGADWDGGGGVTGMEDVSALPKITERLSALGYSKDDLGKIWGGNALRVLRAAEAAAEKPVD